MLSDIFSRIFTTTQPLLLSGTRKPHSLLNGPRFVSVTSFVISGISIHCRHSNRRHHRACRQAGRHEARLDDHRVCAAVAMVARNGGTCGLHSNNGEICSLWRVLDRSLYTERRMQTTVIEIIGNVYIVFQTTHKTLSGGGAGHWITTAEQENNITACGQTPLNKQDVRQQCTAQRWCERSVTNSSGQKLRCSWTYLQC